MMVIFIVFTHSDRKQTKAMIMYVKIMAITIQKCQKKIKVY